MKLLKKLAKKVNWRDLLARAMKTFAQGFVASFSIDAFVNSPDLKTALMGVLVGAIAAGISAVWNMILSFVKGDKEDVRTIAG